MADDDLGVSYPTARARLDELLAALGVAPQQPPKRTTADVFHALANDETTSLPR